MEIVEEPYKELLNAVIIQSVNEYRRALKKSNTGQLHLIRWQLREGITGMYINTDVLLDDVEREYFNGKEAKTTRQTRIENGRSKKQNRQAITNRNTSND